MKASVRVQQTSKNTTINIPKAIKEELKIDKGDLLLLEVVEGKIVITKL